MPTYSSSNSDGLRNTFQIAFVDIDDETDDVDIMINYGSMRNESDEGYCEDSVCNKVAIGLGTYDPDSATTVYNSLVDDDDTILNGLTTDQLWDEGDFALNTLHLNSMVPWRFIFEMRDGELPGTITDSGPWCTNSGAANYDSDASEDDGSCYFWPTNFAGTWTTDSIDLSWTYPYIDVLEVEYFYLTYEPDGEDEIHIDSNATGYLLEWLVPWTEYTLLLCASYDVGDHSEWACDQYLTVSTISVEDDGNESSLGHGGWGWWGGWGGNDNEDEDNEQESETQNDDNESDTGDEEDNQDQEEFDDETQSAYEFALEHGITTVPTIDEAMPFGQLYRRDAAKMIVEFIESVGGAEIKNDDCSFSDLGETELALQEYIMTACSLGFMGVRADGTPAPTFRPNDTLTRAEFGALLSRMLRGDKYNSPNPDAADWYVAHLEALKDAWIITHIENPNDVELRSYAWIIFQRIYEMYDELTSGDESLITEDNLEEGLNALVESFSE